MTTLKNSPRITNGINVTALGEIVATIKQQPELGASKFHSESRWDDNRRVTTTVDDFAIGGRELARRHPHRIDTDVPTTMTGNDHGPTPTELSLGALGACVTTTLVTHAAFKDIQLDSLQVRVEGDIDLRGFLGISDEVRVDCHKVRIDVQIVAALPEAQLREFVVSASRFAPVLDLYRRGTEVEIAINSPTAS